MRFSTLLIILYHCFLPLPPNCGHLRCKLQCLPACLVFSSTLHRAEHINTAFWDCTEIRLQGRQPNEPAKCFLSWYENKDSSSTVQTHSKLQRLSHRNPLMYQWRWTGYRQSQVMILKSIHMTEAKCFWQWVGVSAGNHPRAWSSLCL